MSQFYESLTNTATKLWNLQQTNTLSTRQQYIRRCISFLQRDADCKILTRNNKERNLLEIFVKEQCFKNKCFENKKCKEISSVKDQPMFVNLYKTICHLGRLGTWNLIVVFCESLHWVMLAFWRNDMSKHRTNHLSSAPSACDFEKVYLRIIRYCNKCQVNLFYFQRFDIMFIW